MFDDSVELDVGTAVLRLVNGLSLGSYVDTRHLFFFQELSFCTNL